MSGFIVIGLLRNGMRHDDVVPIQELLEGIEAFTERLVDYGYVVSPMKDVGKVVYEMQKNLQNDPEMVDKIMLKLSNYGEELVELFKLTIQFIMVKEELLESRKTRDMVDITEKVISACTGTTVFWRS